MKKKALVALALVLALAAAGLMAWPHFKTWQFRRVLESEVFPQVHESARKLGWGHTQAAYRTALSEGDDLVITGLEISVRGWPDFNLKIDRLVLRRLGLDWSGNVTGLDCLCQGVSWSGPFGGLEVRELAVEGVSPKNDWQDVTIGRYRLEGISLRERGAEMPLLVDYLESRSCRLLQEPEAGDFVVSQGPVSLNAPGFSLRMSQAAFRGGGAVKSEGWARSAARVDMGELTFSAGGQSVPMQRAHITATVGEATMRARLSLGGLAVKVDSLANPQAQNQLHKLGYDTLNIDAELSYRFERERGLLAIEELSLNLDQAGKITASLELGGVKRDLINNPGQDLDWLEACHLKTLRLIYQDGSLTNRVMASLAKDSGLPQPLFTELAVLGLQARGIWNGIYLGALPAFIKKPESLCLEAKPGRKLTLGQASRLAPEQLAKAWNVKLRACP